MGEGVLQYLSEFGSPHPPLPRPGKGKQVRTMLVIQMDCFAKLAITTFLPDIIKNTLQVLKPLVAEYPVRRGPYSPISYSEQVQGGLLIEPFHSVYKNLLPQNWRL